MRREIINFFLNVHPTFCTAVRAQADHWPPFDDELFLLFTALGLALGTDASLFSERQIEVMTAQIEKGMTEGDEDTVGAVATGLLEGLINGRHKCESAQRVIERLGPKSRAYCHAWNPRYTGGG